MRLIKKKRLLTNIGLNTIASAIPVFSLQLVILPLLGDITDSNEYGLLLTIVSMLNMVPASIAGSLQNIRLLHNNDECYKDEVADFSAVFWIFEIINVLVVFCISSYYMCSFNGNTIKWIHIVLILIIGFLWLARDYFIVSFLIRLNYKRILINNILLASGYFVGLFFSRITGYWECIYLAGFLLSSFYIIFNTTVWKEPPNIFSFNFKVILKENIVYISACMLYRVTTYADKMVLYPILGGTAVSVYYVATLSAKVVSMLTGPISSVMVSYLAQEKDMNKVVGVGKTIKCSLLVCVLGYVFAVIVSRPILTIIYPSYVDAAMDYIYITTATVCVGVMISMLNPYILKLFTMKWQMYINIIVVVIYIFASLLLLNLFGLAGFCMGNLIANVSKLIIMLGIYRIGKRRES